MTDIENLDVEDYDIKNKFSENPYWKEASKTDNIDVEEFEYQQEYKIYKRNKKIAKELCNYLNYRLNKVMFIFLSICMFSLYGLAIVCSIISWKEGNFKAANEINISGIVIGCLWIYTIIEILILDKQFPLRKTKMFKEYMKNLKSNRKQLIKWMRTIQPPKKPEKLPDEEWWN